MQPPREEKLIPIYAHPFVIHERPFCFWDREDTPFQQAFLRGLDPEYFTFVAQSSLAHIEGEHSLRASLAIRIAYSHALETHFALIGAALQAPDSPAGWMLSYRVEDVVELGKAITERAASKNRWGLKCPSWKDVAVALIPDGSNDIDWNELRTASAKLWRFLSKDLLDQSFESENNSAKHGLRVQSGEWYLAMGREEVPGVPAPRDNMRLMGSSKFGSTFMNSTRFAKHNYAYGNQRVNWQPEDLARRLGLVTASTINLVTLLKSLHGVSQEELSIHLFTEGDVADVIKAARLDDAMRFGITSMFNTENLVPLTAEDIMRSYDDSLTDDAFS